MKVEGKAKKENIEYPCLMVCVHEPCLIVLFVDEDKGTILGNDDYEIGKYAINWNMSEFMQFEGSVTLKND